MRNIQSDGSASGGTKAQILPVENATLPYWRTQLHPLDEYRSTEELPSECDIAIIGAGMSGVATAYHLTKGFENGQYPSIVLLEARQVCSGATGRNGGHVKIKSSTVQSLIKHHGLASANEVVQLVSDQIYAIKRTVEAEGLDCEFELRRSYDVFQDETEAEQACLAFQDSLQAGQKSTKEVDFIGEEFAEQLTSIKGAKAALSSPACSLWPYKFVSQLLARMVETELLNLQTNTPVTKIRRDSNSGCSILQTLRGSLKAKKVVFATNAYTAGISPTYLDTIVPYRGTASHISPPSPVFPNLSHTYNISYKPGPGKVDYLNPRPDGGIVVGGGKWMFSADRRKWYNNWDDSTQLEEARPHFDGLMQRHFRGWEDTKATMDYIWTGIQGLTPDEWPHVGEVPDSDGSQYILAGYNGGGMAMIFLCARGLAKMINDGTAFEETGLPRLFKTCDERLQHS